VYMAMLLGATAILAGDPASAERAVRDAQTLVTDPDDHWYQAMLQVDLAHVMVAQGQFTDAAAALVELDHRPLPCDAEWVIRRHTARALLAARVGEPDRGFEDARAAVTAARRTGLIMNRAHAHCTLAELLAATGQADAAARELRRAVTIYETKANAVGAAAARTQFARLLASAP
jgi:ATP/maltotriose-dependent transcriptional regulator MalT